MADDIDRILEVEASAVQKDAEVERIIVCFRLDPYDILELEMGCTEKDIKAAYRKKSLMIHPDKINHPKAREAFDILKKAETELMDTARRTYVNSIIEEAKFKVRKTLPPPLSAAPFTDPYFSSAIFKSQVKQQFKDLMIEEELRKRKLLKKEMEAQGEVDRRADEALNERKRKIEAQKVWEDSRDDRVQGWRNFQAGKTSSGKVLKKKRGHLGFRPPKAVAEESTPQQKRSSDI
ncbi:hypothetical protein BGW38_004436 [Lunasporangiospora selenospora]|uniref:J domain-containing protein n=1 Tax=Lunasporangiospora selenospora TaxID=979761 RepID=A0A9P6FQI1_9FUNG|nr:hypothetical protein BGW38_004436 [Lunasporangiospora selenospora]